MHKLYTPRMVMNRVRLVLRELFYECGIDAEITVAQIPRTRIVRVFVVSKRLSVQPFAETREWFFRVMGEGLTPGEKVGVVLPPYVFATRRERDRFIHEHLP